MSEISQEMRAAELAGRRQAMLGTLAGVTSYLLWALNIVFYRQLTHIDISMVLAQRTIWAGIFIIVLVTALKRWSSVMVHVRNPKTFGTLIMTGWIVGSGWLLYVWMVSVGRGVEVSIGQFMAPLGSVLAGIIFLRERPNMAQTAAVILATAGVAWFVYGLGYLPMIAIYIPFSFVAYTYLRKKMHVDALDGLLIELVTLMPFGFAYLLYIGDDGLGVLSIDARTTVLLLWTGPMTIAPLLAFIYAAKHISMTSLGFMQYIVPTGTFLFAVFLYGEQLTTAHMVTFGLIWIGLIIFTMDVWRRDRAQRRAVNDPAIAETMAEPLL